MNRNIPVWVRSAVAAVLLLAVLFTYSLIPRGRDKIYSALPKACPRNFPCLLSTLKKPDPGWPPITIDTPINHVRLVIKHVIDKLDNVGLVHASQGGRTFHLVKITTPLQLKYDAVLRFAPKGKKVVVELFAAARVAWRGKSGFLDFMIKLRGALLDLQSTPE